MKWGLAKLSAPHLLKGQIMKTYEATVRINANYATVRVVAQGHVQARWQLEALYGAKNVVHLPREVC